MKLKFRIPAFFLSVFTWSWIVYATSLPQAASYHSPDSDHVVDRIVVVKSGRTMTLEKDGHAFKTYKVALGSQPTGAKVRQGDHRTPEGEYLVDAKNAHSQFYLALHLS
jgi:murein L,D-transpeptidase YafK